MPPSTCALQLESRRWSIQPLFQSLKQTVIHRHQGRDGVLPYAEGLSCLPATEVARCAGVIDVL